MPVHTLAALFVVSLALVFAHGFMSIQIGNETFHLIGRKNGAQSVLQVLTRLLAAGLAFGLPGVAVGLVLAFGTSFAFVLILLTVGFTVLPARLALLLHRCPAFSGH